MFDGNLLQMKGMRAVIAALIVAAVIQAALVTGQVIALSSAICNIWNGEPVDAQITLLALFFTCFSACYIISSLRDELLGQYARKRASELRERLLDSALSDRISLARMKGTASTVTAATEGIDEVARYLQTIPPKLCAVVATSLPLLVILFAVDWVSGVIALVAFPVVIGFMVMLGRQARARAESRYAEDERLSNSFLDALRGLETLKSLGADKRMESSVWEASERLRKATVKTLSVATLSSATLDLATVFALAGISMMLAFRLLDGSMGLTTALSALMLAPECFSPIRAYASDFHASLDGRTALASLLDAINPVSSGNQKQNKPFPDLSGMQSFEAHDIGFSYNASATALENVSFSFEPGSKTALVGRSGAGKSTLIDLIAGFKEPCTGTFSIGGETADLEDAAWRSNVHYIPQHPHLFIATLEENIRLYAPNATRDEVVRAAHVAGLDVLVESLPLGLDTVIGEGARELSGGEAQRVALARAIIDDRPILLFDEPTAHLDIETERAVKENVLACMEGKHVFLATHRLHWVPDMDYVLVLDEGRLTAYGRADELQTQLGLSDGPHAEDAFDAPTPHAERECCREETQAALPASTPPITDNAEDSPHPDAQIPSWLIEAVGPNRAQAVIAILLGVISLGCSALLMFTSGYLISRTAQVDTTLFMVMVPVAFVQVFGIGRPVTRYFERLVSHDWVFRITSKTRRALFSAINSDYDDPSRRRTLGAYLEMLADDIAHLQNLYLRVAFPIVMGLLLVVFALVLFAVLSLQLAAALLVCGIATAILVPLLAYSLAKPLHEKAKGLRSEEYAKLADDIFGSVDLALAGRSGDKRARHSARGKAVLLADAALARTTRSAKLVSSIALAFGLCTFVFIGGNALQAGNESVNFVAALALGFFPVIEALLPQCDAATNAPRHLDAIRRLDDVLGQPTPSGQVAERDEGATCQAGIAAKELTYRYPQGFGNAIDHLTLSIPQGQRIAILGASGSGKTTFAALVRGSLTPASGTVCGIDRDGRQLECGLDSLVCYIPQSPYLFDTTLRENLRLAKPEATDDELISALREAGLGTAFEKLPHGLDTPIGETGTGFSGGETHRLALARAFLCDRPIVLLDEPFTALDPETERSLLETLFVAFADKTLIVITHHLAGIERYDRVVFLENGHVLIDGSPAELFRDEPRYRALLAFDHM